MMTMITYILRINAAKRAISNTILNREGPDDRVGRNSGRTEGRILGPSGIKSAAWSGPTAEHWH